MAQPLLRLNRNEYHFPHAPAVLASLGMSSDMLSHYVETAKQQDFGDALSSVLSVDEKNIVLGHGAEDVLIKTLTWLRSGFEDVLTTSFSWTNYQFIASGLNYTCHKVQTQKTADSFYDSLEDIDAFLSRSPRPLVVVLATPNNPTGHALSFEGVERLLTKYSQHFFVIDCVYDNFRSQFLKLSDLPNVCIVGSFSKFFGMPGIRVGFGVSPSLPKAFRMNLGLAPLSIAVCQAALASLDFYQGNRAQMLELAGALRRLSCDVFTVYRSEAPFVLVEFHTEPSVDQLRNAAALSGVEPKIFEQSGKTWLRWGLAPRPIFNQIENYLLKLS